MLKIRNILIEEFFRDPIVKTKTNNYDSSNLTLFQNMNEICDIRNVCEIKYNQHQNEFSEETEVEDQLVRLPERSSRRNIATINLCNIETKTETDMDIENNTQIISNVVHSNSPTPPSLPL